MPKSIPANLEAILLEGIEISPNCLGVINSDKEVIYPINLKIRVSELHRVFNTRRVNAVM
ncbi:hypothetical protein GCM10009409_35420 [Shewanella saliphila]|uniref:Uncharacterized protein n=1 Tax=Shewanella saliphila TaxID=2282698 RepID=A0ABQ2QBB9_9GAMM|nr:hypothetical protein GCM10009409_35420 [Shewanella saliphila]